MQQTEQPGGSLVQSTLRAVIVPSMILWSVILLIMTIAGGPSMGSMSASAQTPLLGGTVLSIDEESLSVTLRMPQGDVRSFATINRQVLRGIAPGDHVSLELDGDDRITKLIKLPTDPAN